MSILYIFPHPDDESFGPAPLMARQRRQGHQVYLLTLTRGGATKQRLRLGYSVEEMGVIRYREMQEVEQVLDLSGMTVLDLPDSGLKEMDPRRIEDVVRHHLKELVPDVVVTYPVHGISGFHDHLVTHAVVKRVFVEMRETGIGPRRLAFFTLTEEQAARNPEVHLNGSTADEIDCICRVDESDIQTGQSALDCYRTYQQTIRRTGIRDLLDPELHFELFDESHHPPLDDLFDSLPSID